MEIERRYTTEGKDPYDGISFVERTSRIVNPDGSVAFEATIMAPESWSQVAVDILAQKYCRKAGVAAALKPVAEDGVPVWLQRHEADEAVLAGLPEEQRFVGENDARQVFGRLAGCWAYWGYTHGYFDEQGARAFRDELSAMLALQVAAPNSPQWFNTGLHWAYGISGPAQGHWYCDAVTGELKRSTSAYERPAPHACFIQSVDDDLVNEGGIMDLWVREARVFKYGSGTGSNFSRLRGSDERLSGGGRSSGLMSFLKIGDRAAGAIKSGGTTRRAAKMVTLDLDHPDIEQYVRWKVVEETKVAALVAGSKMLNRHLNAVLAATQEGEGDDRFIARENPALAQAVRGARAGGVPDASIQRTLDLAKQGVKELQIDEYDTDWQGEAYLTVSGQNSNNSVRITNAFMEAVEKDAEWPLYDRTELVKAETQGRAPAASKVLRARDLWDQICEAAWLCADPGIQFHDTTNEWHTCPADGEIVASNPCAEYVFLDDTACNLASMNLMKFDQGDRFDHVMFRHASRLWTIVLEISVLMAQFPSREIAERSYLYRTLGLGYANLGALSMQRGLAYDSPEAYAFCGAVSAIMHFTSLATSAELAAEQGTFDAYERNKDDMLRVVRNHRRAAYAADAAEYEGLQVTPEGIDATYCEPDLLEVARYEADRALALGEMHGFRNAQVTLIAPTGTIGLVMDCDTTGIEPDFALVKFKKLAGGGYFKIVNASVPPALEHLGYTPEQVDDIVRYCVGTGSLSGVPHIHPEALRSFGFTEAMLAAVETALPTAFDVRFAFTRYTVGDDAIVENLGIDREDLDAPGFDLLKALGFSDAELDEANTAVCGTMTVEGAPHEAGRGRGDEPGRGVAAGKEVAAPPARDDDLPPRLARRHVHGHEGAALAGAGRVDRARQKLLVSAALAPDEDAEIPGGHLLGRLAGADGGRVLRGEAHGGLAARQVLPPRLLRELADGAADGLLLDGGVEHLEQALLVHRLGEVVEGAELHGPDGELHIAHAGQDDGGDLQLLVPDGLQDVHAAEVGHVQVQEHGVELPLPQQARRLARIVEHGAVVLIGLGQEDHEVVRHRRVVVYDQDLGHGMGIRVRPLGPALGRREA